MSPHWAPLGYSRGIVAQPKFLNEVQIRRSASSNIVRFDVYTPVQDSSEGVEVFDFMSRVLILVGLACLNAVGEVGQNALVMASSYI